MAVVFFFLCFGEDSFCVSHKRTRLQQTTTYYANHQPVVASDSATLTPFFSPDTSVSTLTKLVQVGCLLAPSHASFSLSFSLSLTRNTRTQRELLLLLTFTHLVGVHGMDARHPQAAILALCSNKSTMRFSSLLTLILPLCVCVYESSSHMYSYDRRSPSSKRL